MRTNQNHLRQIFVSIAVALLGLLSISAAQAQIATIYSFTGTGTDGSFPFGGLTLSGGTLYGTTYFGGSSSGGTVFSIPVTGGPATTLYSFTGVGSDGAQPESTLTVSGGTLYGTTYGGGADGDGTVFSLPTTGGTANILYAFNNATFNVNGGFPRAGVIVSGSTLYGVAGQGGAGPSDDGTVFSVDLNTNTLTTLHSFDPSAGEGALPWNNLSLNGNTLYGTTANGGSNNDGTVFSLDLNTNTLTTIHSFTGTGADGANPYSGLTLSGTMAYGATGYGGSNGNGTLFSLNINTNTLTTLYSFSGADGDRPTGDLTLSGTTLFGTTDVGGSSNAGTVFSFDLTTDTVTTLHNFTNSGGDGANPNGGVIFDGSMIFGTTAGGGSFGNGTVFSVEAVPEPSTWVMLLGGLGLLGLWHARTRRVRLQVSIGVGS